MSDLFQDMPQELSPRLRWMQDKGVRTMRAKDGRWIAYKSETQHNWTEDDEVDAVVGLAKKLKIKLWNE